MSVPPALFSNTQPRWPLAQPFRYLAHNGEINTIEGNRQWAKARAYKFSSPLLPDLQTAAPFVNETGSDSLKLRQHARPIPCRWYGCVPSDAYACTARLAKPPRHGS